MSAKKKLAKAKNFVTDTAVLAAYKKMIDGVPEVEWKGATRPYTSWQGNMFSHINRDNIIGLRLSKTDLKIFMEEYDAGLFEGYPGFFQKEYVAMPPAIYDNVRIMRKWFRKAFANVSALKPKPTNKPKK
ncbi:hypothetical protein [Kordiimonas aquimaris]|uniref:hypothetical protein n=1 Tax=Kordiimonas aquimaris TaxID=707591 RepID=UPI0021CF968D|nr:hypothetical protein [Kordiimonas aquimaris]